MYCYGSQDRIQLVLDDKLLSKTIILDSASGRVSIEWCKWIAVQWADSLLGPLWSVDQIPEMMPDFITLLTGGYIVNTDKSIRIYWESMDAKPNHHHQ